MVGDTLGTVFQNNIEELRDRFETKRKYVMQGEPLKDYFNEEELWDLVDYLHDRVVY